MNTAYAVHLAPHVRSAIAALPPPRRDAVERRLGQMALMAEMTPLDGRSTAVRGSAGVPVLVTLVEGLRVSYELDKSLQKLIVLDLREGKPPPPDPFE